MDFWKIYDQYYGPVRKFILAYVKDEWVADDLIQERFVQIQTNLNGVRDSSKISSWIFRIAHNLCYDHFRQSKRSTLNQRNIQKEIVALREAAVQKELEQQQMGECVQDKMDRLPPDYRTALILSDIMTFSQKEIAEILDISVSNVKVRVHRAQKMRAIWRNMAALRWMRETCSFAIPRNKNTEATREVVTQVDIKGVNRWRATKLSGLALSGGGYSHL